MINCFQTLLQLQTAALHGENIGRARSGPGPAGSSRRAVPLDASTAHALRALATAPPAAAASGQQSALALAPPAAASVSEALALGARLSLLRRCVMHASCLATALHSETGLKALNAAAGVNAAAAGVNAVEDGVKGAGGGFNRAKHWQAATPLIEQCLLPLLPWWGGAG